MRTEELEPQRTVLDAVVAAATAGDERAFGQLVDRHRRELQVYTYRILGSTEDSADATQETFLRAWRMRTTFRGRGSFRSWLYRIATNVCLSALERRSVRRQVAAGRDAARVARLRDEPLEEIASADPEPDDEVVSRETVELVFLAAVRHLPPRQCAVLICRDVLGWSARETAELLGTSIASVTSAVQRARETLRKELPRHRLEWASATDPSAEERKLVERYLDAVARGHADEFVAVLHDHVGFRLASAPAPARVAAGCR